MLQSKKTHCGRCGNSVSRSTKYKSAILLACYECSTCDRAHAVILRIGNNTNRKPVGDVFDYSKAKGPF